MKILIFQMYLWIAYQSLNSFVPHKNQKYFNVSKNCKEIVSFQILIIRIGSALQDFEKLIFLLALLVCVFLGR